MLTTSAGVAVVIPCYNTQPAHLLEALDSVSAQTLPAAEVIIVNDGSTDPILLELLDVLADRERYRVLHQPNAGPAAARNAAVAESRCTYILPLDSDDRIAPCYLEKAVDVLELRPDVSVVYGEAEFFGSRRGRMELPAYSPRTILTENTMYNSCVYRRTAFDAAGGYNASMRLGLEDHEFWMRLCAVTGPPHRLRDTVFFYRISDGTRNSVVSLDREAKIQSWAEIFRRNHALYAEYPDVLFRIIESNRAELEYWRGRYGSADHLIRRWKVLDRATRALRRSPLGRRL